MIQKNNILNKKYLNNSVVVVMMLLSVFVIGLFFQIVIKERKEFGFEKIFSRFEKRGLLNHKYDEYIGVILDGLSPFLGNRFLFQVNKRYSNDVFCVYVINVHDYLPYVRKEADNKADNEIVRLASKNIIFMKPNILLVDIDFLRLLVLCCTNDAMAFAQAADQFAGKDEMYIQKIANNYLRFKNIIAYNNYDEWVSNNNYWKRSPSKMVDDVVDVWRDDKNKKHLYALVLPYYATIFGHELGHYFYHTDRNRVLSSMYLEKNVVNQTVVNEEVVCDYFARNLVKKMLFSLNKEDVGLSNLFFIQSVISFSELLRDMTLVRVYDGFRGYSSEDLVFFFQEKGEMNELTKSLMFTNMDRIEKAEMHPYPIMTEMEFRSVVNKLRKDSLSIKHQHDLYRYNFFLINELFSFLSDDGKKMIELYNKDCVDIHIKKSLNFEDLLKSLNFEMNIDKSGKGVGLSLDEILCDIRNYFSIEKGVCASGQNVFICKRASMYVELWGEHDNIKKVIMVRKMLPVGFLNGNNTENDAFVKNIEDVLISMRLFMNLAKKTSEASVWLENHFGDVYDRTGTVSYNVDGYKININRVNESRVLRMWSEIDD